MELSIDELKMNEATMVMDFDSEDPYQITQVHDYHGTHFFRTPLTMRTATKKTIDVLTMAYPGMVKKQFFIRIPTIVRVVFKYLRPFLSKKMKRDFHPIIKARDLAPEVGTAGEHLPSLYGGRGLGLEKFAKTTILFDDRVPTRPRSSRGPYVVEQPVETETGLMRDLNI